jgi:transcriptional regulator with XRE-family HTH domain
VRRWRGISQRELADFAGVRRSTISRIESGQTARPSLELMDRIVRAGGFALVIADVHDRLLELDDHRGRLRDRGGRRYPAHLELFKVRWGGPPWWGWSRIAWLETDQACPEWSFYRRPTHGYAPPFWITDAT